MRRDSGASARYTRGVGKDDREKTPPTGTAIPRPRLRSVEVAPGLHQKSFIEPLPMRTAEPGEGMLPPLPESAYAAGAMPLPVVDFSRLPSSPPAPPQSSPLNPTLKELYDLIDQRISPQIVERISSTPPAAKADAPRPSLPVRVAKGTGRWTKWAMAALGVLTLVGEIWADVEKYRGPISQLLVFAARQMDAHEAPELTPEPE